MLLHYLGISKIKIFCKYAADIGKMQTNRIFSAPILFYSTCITVYAESIYVFLSKSCPHHWMPRWLLTNTAVTSAVTNFRCHRLIAKVNK